MVTLTNVGTTYDAVTASRGLGMGYFNFTGKTQALVMVKVNKVGTGIQSWQVWNETDGVEVGVLSDAGLAGVKDLSTTLSINGSGLKLLRFRAKSTISTDDPVFLGGTVYLQ